jgi:hypothetical protein
MRPICNQAIVLLLSSFVLSVQPGFAIANESATPARQIKAWIESNVITSAPRIGSARLGSLFLTLPTAGLTGQQII